MNTTEKVEGFLLDMELSYRELEKNTWMVEDESGKVNNIVIKYEDPVVLFRVKVMTVPQANREDFFRKVLEFNASDMIYGAYGLEGDSLVIINTLAAENLDLNEFQSTIESVSLALMEHFPILQKYIAS